LRDDLKPEGPVQSEQRGLQETQSYQALNDSGDRGLRGFA